MEASSIIVPSGHTTSLGCHGGFQFLHWHLICLDPHLRFVWASFSLRLCNRCIAISIDRIGSEYPHRCPCRGMVNTQSHLEFPWKNEHCFCLVLSWNFSHYYQIWNLACVSDNVHRKKVAKMNLKTCLFIFDSLRLLNVRQQRGMRSSLPETPYTFERRLWLRLSVVAAPWIA